MARSGLHSRLWAETRAHHQAVDTGFGALSLESVSGYRQFLQAHACALTCVGTWLTALDSPHKTVVSHLLVKLAEDLDVLETPMPPAMKHSEPMQCAAPADDTGIFYVVAGSSLGARILLRRVPESAETPSGRATRYLGDAHLQGAWRTFRTQLATLPATGAKADRCVAAARQTFECYGAALHQTGRD